MDRSTKTFEDVVELLDQRSGSNGKVKEQLSTYKNSATRLAESGWSFASQYAAIEGLHDFDIATGQAVYKDMLEFPKLHIDLKKEHETSFAEQFAAAIMVYDTFKNENIYIADVLDIYDENRSGDMILNAKKLAEFKSRYHKNLSAYCLSDEAGPEPYIELRDKISSFETGPFVASIKRDTAGAQIERLSGSITDPRKKTDHKE